MKRVLCAVAFVVAAGAPASAQESVDNELELVQKLRAKGWNDLARARIDHLLRLKNPELDAVLPYELARINIAEARQKDPDQRVSLFTTARNQLKDFIDKNKSKPSAAIASVELARVTSYHAEAILAKALREETAAERHLAARPAEALFVQAGKELEVAVAALETALNIAPPELKPRLEREFNQARFDIGKNYFNQGRTVLDISENVNLVKRSSAIDKARTEFKKLRKDESSQVGWLAVAWLMKCSIELDAPEDFKEHYYKVWKRRNDPAVNPDIAPAVRMVRFFALQDLAVRPKETETIGRNVLAVPVKTEKERLQRLRKDADDWLKIYANHLKTYEGEGVLFELAESYMTEARSDENDIIRKVVDRLNKDKALKGKGGAVEEALRKGDFEKAKTAWESLSAEPGSEKLAKQLKPLVDEGETIKKITGPIYDKAIVYFEKLAELDGELAERARQTSTALKYTRLDLKGNLSTFTEFMMKARIERNAVITTSIKLEEHGKRVAAAGGDEAKLKALAAEKKAIDADRKKALKDVIASLHRALALATTKTPLKEIDDARYFLSGAYLASGDAQRAAIVAEAIARGKASRRASESAGTAIATYAALSARDPNDAVVKKRLFDLTEFVLAEKSWEKDTVTSTAHYHLGMVYRESDPKKAITHLEKITADFPDFIYVQGQIVFIGEAARDKSEDKAVRKEFTDAARRALARMPKLNPKTDSATVIVMYFYAKLEQSRFLYSDAIEQLNAKESLKAIKLLNEMKAYVNGLRGEFDQVSGTAITPQNREQLDFSMGVMLKYADLGIAETKFRSDAVNRFDEVLEATKTVVNDMLKRPKEGNIKLKDYRVTGDILGLALRATVQKGDVKRGTEILDILKRLTDPEEKQAGNVVGALLNDIAGQIQRMKKEDPKALEETKKNYTAFLDEIARGYDKKDTRSVLMLAQAYKSLEYPSKAAPLFGDIKPPANFDKVMPKPKNETEAEVKARQEWEEDVARYCAVQIEYIRTLRAAKDKTSLETGAKAAQALIDNKNAKYSIQAMMEKNLIYEDQERYREAYLEWQKFLALGPLKNLADANVQKIYYPGYFYYTRTCYRMAVHDPKIVNRQKFIDAAANLIIKLEKSKAGWAIAGPMFKELLEDKDSRQLKDAYDKFKADQPKTMSIAVPRLHLAREQNSAPPALSWSGLYLTGSAYLARGLVEGKRS